MSGDYRLAMARFDGKHHPSAGELWVRLRPRQRAVDHGDRTRNAIHGDEGAEARALFLAEQHLVEHVEPVERDAGTAVLALLHRIKERLAAAGLLGRRL